VEEAAEPYAELNWLLDFPGVFEDSRARLIRYAVVLGRAQATVIEHYAAQTEGPAPSPHALARREFERLHASGVVGLSELQWQVERLGRAALEAQMRRQGYELGGAAPAGSSGSGLD
jgi:hypothetical protein